MAILERVLVTSIDNMADETFAKHMEHRHADSLGYITGLQTVLSNDMLVRMWRLYHARLHQWRIDLKHEHGEL